MKKWTKEEDNFLIEKYSLLSVEEISEKINRSENAINWRASFFGLTKKRNTGWSKKELELLKTDKSNSEISRIIGRSVTAVNKKRIIERSKTKYFDYIDTSAIENGIPNIDINSKSSQYLAMLQKMTSGQSFEYTSSEHTLLRNQILLIHNKKFQTKKWTNETRRCWCI